MEIVLNFSNIICLTGIITCFFAALVLWRFANANNRSNRLLSLYFFCLSYAFLVVFLLYTQLMQYPPWFYLYRTGNVAGLAFMPLSFLYIRSILRQRELSFPDLIHLLPVLLFIVDYIPFYFSDAAVKQAQAIADTALPDRGQRIYNGWIGID